MKCTSSTIYLVYDKHSGALIGFVDLGNTNNQILEFEKALSAESTDRELASTVLVFMVRGLLCKFNYPYYNLLAMMLLEVRCLAQCGKPCQD